VNYRHAFHAGNHADVLKHLILVQCLDSLKRKDAPFAAFETHAGRGLYNLDSDEAQRSPEWRDGIGKLWGWSDAPPAVRAYLDAIGDGPLYPGSPLIAQRAMRPQDRLMLCELHPEEFALLKQVTPHAQLHHRDGYEALKALTPFAERRGLILIDPPYEATDEFAQALDALKAARKRFRQGVYLWWRPIKDDAVLSRADAELASMDASQDMLRADLWIDTPRAEGKLTGSSVLLINPPFGLEAALREALPALAAQLSLGDGGWRLSKP
jgi:23S rRNA (adenine2030-N6)-methyltransferase